MNRKEGYYVAVAPGPLNQEVIIYWDGDMFKIAGSSVKLLPKNFMFIEERPIFDYVCVSKRNKTMIDGSSWDTKERF